MSRCISWCLIRSRNGITSLNFKKNSYNNPKCGQMRRVRIHSTVQMTKISLTRQSSNKTETFYFTLKTWLPFQVRKRPTCHPVKNMHILNPINKTAARHPHLKTVNLSKTENTGTHTALFSGIDRKDKERKQSSCRQNPFTVQILKFSKQITCPSLPISFISDHIYQTNKVVVISLFNIRTKSSCIERLI